MQRLTFKQLSGS